jgi:DNA-directed RNA polymerase specialized sigma24 family protein
MKKSERERRITGVATFIPEETGTLSAVERAAVRAEEILCLRGALRELSEPDRLLIELRFFRGMTLRAMADHFQVSVTTCWCRIERVLGELRSLVLRRAADLTE